MCTDIRHKVQKKAQSTEKGTKYRFKACNVQCTVHVKDTMYIKQAHEIYNRHKVHTVLQIRKRHVKYKKGTREGQNPRYVKQVHEKKARWLNHVE